MRRLRTAVCLLALTALALAIALLTTSGSSAAPSKSQALFEKTLLEDDKTTAAIKELLSGGGGIVAPDITFADLTGDDRSDAIVLVDTKGAAGAVALYVFSTHGEAEESDLRAVYRSQRLYRADAEVSGRTLILRTPRCRGRRHLLPGEGRGAGVRLERGREDAAVAPLGRGRGPELTEASRVEVPRVG